MDAAARWAHGHRIPGHARTLPQIPIQTDIIRTKRTSVWGRAVELTLHPQKSAVDGRSRQACANVSDHVEYVLEKYIQE